MSSKFEVVVPDCPVPPPPSVGGVPSWVVGASFGVGTVILLALIFGVSFVIVSWREEKTLRIRAQNTQELELAKLHKTCGVCGADYTPLPQSGRGKSAK